MNAIKLRTLPLQLIETDDGVLLKRGNTILNVNGQGAKAAVPQILSSLALPGCTKGEVVQKFSGPDRLAVDEFIEKLVVNHMAVSIERPEVPEPSEESHLDIFYWHFGESTHQVTTRLNRQHMTIMGANHISRRLSAALLASGMDNHEIVDDPLLRNTRLVEYDGTYRPDAWTDSRSPRHFDDWQDNLSPASMSCLVATCDFGGMALLREWNQFCIENKIFFLPVVLQDQVGYAGPLVIPGETACLECLLARQDSHRTDRQSSRSIEESAHEGQAVVGFHPSMASILGDIAAFELTKFFGGILPGWSVGTVLEVNLLSGRMTPRKVLKVPRCAVCSPLITRPPSNPYKSSRFPPMKEKA